MLDYWSKSYFSSCFYSFTLQCQYNVLLVNNYSQPMRKCNDMFQFFMELHECTLNLTY